MPTTATRHKTRSITIIGRRWFQRGPGNTYHAVDILVDGKQVHSVGFRYGYGDMYNQTAREWLNANGYLPCIENLDGTPGESLWRYCERSGINFVDTVTDVPRKKDL